MSHNLRHWRPRISLNSAEESLWTEDAFHRVLVNFSSTVEQEIRRQQEEVAMVRAQMEIEMDQERDMLIQRNAAHREEHDTTNGATGATVLERYRLEMFDADQKKEWTENEEALAHDCPLAFLSEDVESSLSFFSLFPRMQAALARLTREQVRGSVLNNLPRDQDEAKDGDQETGLRCGSTTTSASVTTEVRQYHSARRRKELAQLAPPRFDSTAGVGTQQDNDSTQHTDKTPTQSTVMDADETGTERKYSELSKLVDLRNRARQRMLLLSGAYCTPQSLAELRRRRRRQRTSDEEPQPSLASSLPQTQLWLTPTEPAAATLVEPAPARASAAPDLTVLRGEAWLDAMSESSCEAIEATQRVVERALESETQNLVDRLAYAEAQLAALEAKAAANSGRGRHTKARKTHAQQTASTASPPPSDEDGSSLAAALVMWRQEVTARREEVRTSPRCAGFRSLLVDLAQRLAQRRGEEDATQAAAVSSDHGVAPPLRAAPVPSSDAQAPRPHLQEPTAQNADGQRLGPRLPVMMGFGPSFRTLLPHNRNRLVELLCSQGGHQSWLYRETPPTAATPSSSSEARPSRGASVVVRTCGANNALGPPWSGVTDRSSGFDEEVSLLELDVEETEEQKAVAYMEKLASQHLWPHELESRIGNVLYAIADSDNLPDVRTCYNKSTRTMTDDNNNNNNTRKGNQVDESDGDNEDGDDRSSQLSDDKGAGRGGVHNTVNALHVCQFTAQEITAATVSDATTRYPMLDGPTLLQCCIVPRSDTECAPTVEKSLHRAAPRNEEPPVSHLVRPLCTLVEECGTTGEASIATAPIAAAHGSLVGRSFTIPRLASRAVLHLDGHGDFGASTLLFRAGSDKEWRESFLVPRKKKKK